LNPVVYAQRVEGQSCPFAATWDDEPLAANLLALVALRRAVLRLWYPDRRTW
jgi:hypothetical protein